MKGFMNNFQSTELDNEIITNVYLLTSKQSTSTTWFSFREGVITASVVHEFLPKLNSKTPLHKNKASINLCEKICGYQKNLKKVNFENVVHPRRILHEKDMLQKTNCHIYIFSAKSLDYSYFQFIHT